MITDQRVLTDKQREYVERRLTALIIDMLRESKDELLSDVASEGIKIPPPSIDGDVRFCNETDLRIDVRISIPRELWMAARKGIEDEMECASVDPEIH